MAISTEIQRLKGAKASLKTSIENKGVTVPSSTKLDGYAALVDQISQGVTEYPENDVNFYDYDGFRVASYTLAEAKALTALPTPPTHEGLTFQEWNWTLADIQTYDRQYADIGANYTTTDGKTHIFAVIEGDVSLVLNGKNGVVSIDWGDGSVTESYTYGNIGTNHLFTHTYTELGDKHISVGFTQTNTDGVYSFANTSSHDSNGWYGLQVKEVRFGNFVFFSGTQNFYFQFDTKYSLPNSAFINTFDLFNSYFKTIVIPRNTSLTFTKAQASIGEHLIFPKSIGNFGNNAYTFYLTNLSGRLIIPTFTNTSALNNNTFATLVTAIVGLPSCTSFASDGNQINLANLYYIDISQGWTPNVSMNLNTSQNWSAGNMVKFFNKLGTTSSAITLTFGSTNLNKLTADQKAIATNKGYTLA